MNLHMSWTAWIKLDLFFVTINVISVSYFGSHFMWGWLVLSTLVLAAAAYCLKHDYMEWMKDRDADTP